MMNRFYNYYDYWELRHKVTFDPIKKLVFINPGETEIYMGRDVYSSFKEWFQIYENSQYHPVMRTIGGDPTTGGNRAGTIYFFINGWRIYLESAVNIFGSVFSDDFDSPYITAPTARLAFSQVSNLVDRVPETIPALTSEQEYMLSETARKSQLVVINEGVKRASKLIPHNQNLE